MQLRIEYVGNADVSINALGLHMGLKSLGFRGDFIFRFNPILAELPVIGGLVMCFLDPPFIDLDMTGLASLCDAPIVSGILRRTVNAAIAEKLVLPNVISVPIGSPEQGVDNSKLHSPSVKGLLRITAVSACDLMASDWSLLGRGTSDPYLIIRLADAEWRSTTVNRNCNPKWPEGNTHDFMVYDLNQSFVVEVYDEDMGKPDDYIGRSRPHRIADAIQRPERDVQLFLPDAIQAL